jgi:hypothetical protein
MRLDFFFTSPRDTHLYQQVTDCKYSKFHCKYQEIKFTKNHNKENLAQSTIPKKIVFNEQRGLLIVEGVDIEIPYATNQFYLLKMLFSNSFVIGLI